MEIKEKYLKRKEGIYGFDSFVNLEKKQQEKLHELEKTYLEFSQRVLKKAFTVRDLVSRIETALDAREMLGKDKFRVGKDFVIPFYKCCAHISVVFAETIAVVLPYYNDKDCAEDKPEIKPIKICKSRRLFAYATIDIEKIIETLRTCFEQEISEK